ncbi:MAG: hypothetical protein SOW44_05765 [Porphyromonas sp.]|nr:hypothetical protein [Bacteroidales bacterium]MDY3100832.1 hypothetical protein [Porphyromonas sp.]
MSFHGKLYLPLLFALTGLLGGCHSAVLGDYPDTCATGEEQQVRITAVIEGYAVQGDPASTRSGIYNPGTPGDLEEGDATPFQPEVVKGDEVENKITNMVVYIFKKGAGDDDLPVKKLVVGAAPGTTYASGFEYVAFETNNMEQGKASFLTSLPPGTYEFYFLVNDLGLSPITGTKNGSEDTGSPREPESFPIPATKGDLKAHKLDRDALKDPEISLALMFTYELNYMPFGSELTSSLMPMFGMTEVSVPALLPTQIYKVTPEVKLERLLAKVEFYLTTARMEVNPETGAEEPVYLSPLLDYVTEQWTDSQLRSQSLFPASFLYLRDRRIMVDYGFFDIDLLKTSFVPLEGEYTATQNSNITAGDAPSASIFDESYTNSMYSNNRALWTVAVGQNYVEQEPEEEDPATRSVVVDNIERRGIRKMIREKSRVVYMRPFFFKDADEATVPFFRFLCTTHFPDPVDRYFDIPIHTVTDNSKNPEFSIRRNTIYRIYATLNIDADGEVTLDLLHNVGDYPTVNIPVPPFN